MEEEIPLPTPYTSKPAKRMNLDENSKIARRIQDKYKNLAKTSADYQPMMNRVEKHRFKRDKCSKHMGPMRQEKEKKMTYEEQMNAPYRKKTVKNELQLGSELLSTQGGTGSLAQGGLSVKAQQLIEKCEEEFQKNCTFKPNIQSDLDLYPMPPAPQDPNTKEERLNRLYLPKTALIQKREQIKQRNVDEEVI